jgi:hypothetical protein
MVIERKERAALHIIAACRDGWDYVSSADHVRDHLQTSHLWRVHPRMLRISLPAAHMA